MRLELPNLARFNALCLLRRPVCSFSAATMSRPAGPEPEVYGPEQVLDFPTLYRQNCAACHGVNGKNGAAIPLANPVYLAIAGEDTSRRSIAKGVPGKLMPPSRRAPAAC